MQLQNQLPINIEDEMKRAYLDYSMSVIVGRALPDVRDGFKPVHRRVLYAMYELSMFYNRPFKKSARVVGEVLGKFHPHGDTAVYDTIVRMVQDFSLRHPLIWGQGNFGSVDGDSPAAMRYTEIKLKEISSEMLTDLDKDTVEWAPNFDGSLEEPTVLPSRIPNLMINGSSGIAVGMATNIPPHNLGEVVDGLIALIGDSQISIQELMKYVKGPDFPTAGFITGRKGIVDAYTTGRGLVKMLAKVDEEEAKKGERERIIISELPYQVNKARLVEQIADLVKDKKIEGISDIRDESDREGMRVVIELKRGENSLVVKNLLFKHTPLRSTFGVILLALVDNRPKVLNLKEMLLHYLNHRREIIIRRTQFDLRKAEQRCHILEGLIKALDQLDPVIKLIRASKTPDEAKTGLVEKFNLSPVQAQAILDMRLQRLTGLERDKIKEEHKQLLMDISRYEAILDSPAMVNEIIKEELLEVRKKFADKRRTLLVEAMEDYEEEDLIAEEKMVVAVTQRGYIKRSSLDLYKIQKRSGVGVRGITTKEEDFVEQLFVCSTHAYLLFFTDLGRVYWKKVYRIPQMGRHAKGTAMVNLLKLSQDEKVTAILPARNFEEDLCVVMATKNGIIKKSRLKDYSNPRSGGIIAINLDEDDRLISVRMTDGHQNVFMGTEKGQAICFAEEQVRTIGRVGRGVIGVRLREGDHAISMDIVGEEDKILTVTERGFGKVSALKNYRKQNRGGYGVMNLRITKKNGNVVTARKIEKEDSIMLITTSGTIIWMRVANIRVIGRVTQGVRLQRLDKEEQVVAVARLAVKEEKEIEESE
jgi:DNA gyrase subunit A